MTSTERERRTACHLVFLPRCAEVWINTRVDRSVLGWAKNPVPALPNAIFGPPGDFTHAWASFRASRVFGPVPHRSLFYQTKPNLFGSKCAVSLSGQEQETATNLCSKEHWGWLFASLRHPHKLLLFLVLVCTAWNIRKKRTKQKDIWSQNWACVPLASFIFLK
jgi:hypothetical protein